MRSSCRLAWSDTSALMRSSVPSGSCRCLRQSSACRSGIGLCLARSVATPSHCRTRYGVTRAGLDHGVARGRVPRSTSRGKRPGQRQSGPQCGILAHFTCAYILDRWERRWNYRACEVRHNSVVLHLVGETIDAKRSQSLLSNQGNRSFGNSSQEDPAHSHVE